LGLAGRRILVWRSLEHRSYTPGAHVQRIALFAVNWCNADI